MSAPVSKFGESVHFPGSAPVTAYKGTGRFSYLVNPKVVATWHEEGNAESVGMDRDEAQTLVDFLIEAIEEWDEANTPQPLNLEDLQVGRLYEVVANEGGHDFLPGTLVHVLGPDECGGVLVTRDLNVTKWEYGDGAACRYVADGDLAETSEPPF